MLPSLILAALNVLIFCSDLQGAVTIVLQEEVSIKGPELFLSDVAELRGDDEAVLSRLARSSLGDAPPLGMARTLNWSQVRAALPRTAGTGELSFIGAAVVRVRLKTRPLTSEEIIPIVRAHIAAVTSWKENEIDVQLIRDAEEVELPLREVNLRITGTKAPSTYRMLRIAVEAHCGGKLIHTFWVTADVRVRATVVQASRAIRFGKVLSGGDLAEICVDITNPQWDYVRTMDAAVGQISKRTLSPGDLIIDHYLERRDLVRSGDVVHLRLIRSGVSIATLARAEQSGNLGECIRVRSIDFKRAVTARITGDSEVIIQ